MQFGLFNLMTQRERDASQKRIFDETAEQVQVAEALGFNTAWFAEHHFSNYCLCPSPIAMAIHLAGQTRKIRLGTAVAVAPLYHPLRMLEDFTLLDVLSAGRAVIGLGSGYQQYEFHKFGVELGEGRARFLEILDIVEQFISSGSVDFHGQYFQIPEAYFSLRTVQARPPIYVAGLGEDPEMQGRIKRQGYVPFFNKGWNTLDGLKAVRSKTMEGSPLTRETARAVPYSFQQYVYVAESKADALKAADGARYIRRIALSMRNRSAKVDRGFLTEQPVADEPDLDLLVDRMLIGDVDKCTRMLISELEALQPTHMSCFMNIPGVPHGKVLRSMELFSTQVMKNVESYFGGWNQVGAPEPGRSEARTA
jgi:alkanesulfonate monooxygenase SsuD/methylene tetrahydromethanopterin reductase-like flavin-dependent oxidoreductase (luciferase family)